MALYKALALLFDGVTTREKGEVFEFDDQKMIKVTKVHTVEKLVKGQKISEEVSEEVEQKIQVSKDMELVESKDKSAHEKAHAEQAKAGATQKGSDLRSQNDVNALAAQKGRQDVI